MFNGFFQSITLNSVAYLADICDILHLFYYKVNNNLPLFLYMNTLLGIKKRFKNNDFGETMFKNLE